MTKYPSTEYRHKVLKLPLVHAFCLLQITKRDVTASSLKKSHRASWPSNKCGSGDSWEKSLHQNLRSPPPPQTAPNNVKHSSESRLGYDYDDTKFMNAISFHSIIRLHTNSFYGYFSVNFDGYNMLGDGFTKFIFTAACTKISVIIYRRVARVWG